MLNDFDATPSEVIRPFAAFPLIEVGRLALAYGSDRAGAEAEVALEKQLRVDELAEVATEIVLLNPESDSYDVAAQRLAAAIDSLGLRAVVLDKLIPNPTPAVVQQARLLAGISQQELAKTLGVLESKVSRVLNGKRKDPKLLQEMFRVINQSTQNATT